MHIEDKWIDLGETKRGDLYFRGNETDLVLRIAIHMNVASAHQPTRSNSELHSMKRKLQGHL